MAFARLAVAGILACPALHKLGRESKRFDVGEEAVGIMRGGAKPGAGYFVGVTP
ncbi:hypothetical protein N7E70_004035 [Aminobacter sp. NyZ550]|jgi:hypothetical protein|uniref:Uncharacterized protein n=3 Tax=Aminobacter TaxID=31988 RepID=A0ABR6H990_AMIAI|nr:MULTISPECIES: hypothetical protein [Aminobacter]MBA8906439.1 hypothetical protein [Aminobacter ciceronei]MBA9020218.1 hypothetical protein [Aminobacter ciceronei]MBB3707082.1 hypothetical protein [Aminobacter aminovorans]MRX35377.1 hypothetical protein [Aminobacter sp. MDW-2]QNH35269.1 hypothetical protein H5P29_04930 [Aminobacter sp. MDW-2]